MVYIGVQVLTGGFNGSEPDDCTGTYVICILSQGEYFIKMPTIKILLTL